MTLKFTTSSTFNWVLFLEIAVVSVSLGAEEPN